MRLFSSLRASLSASHKAAFRVVHFSVQSDHVHLVVEGDAPVALIRGVQGLAGRCAKAINRAAARRGRVWISRFHSHALRTPTETRRGLVYVLLNFRKHLRAAPGVDPRSSGPWFDGWRTAAPTPRDCAPFAAPRARLVAAETVAVPVVTSRTWLATVGWRRAGGAIAFDERPTPAHASTNRRAGRERPRTRPQ